MRTVLFYVCQILLGLGIYSIGYLGTYRIDYFSWGNSNADGLYLLFIPVVNFPVILVVSLVKYLVVRKWQINSLYKWSFLGWLFFSLMCALLVLADAMWSGLVVSLLTAVGILMETVLVTRKIVRGELKANN